MRGLWCGQRSVDISCQPEYQAQFPYHSCVREQESIRCCWLQRWSANQSDREIWLARAKSLGNPQPKDQREHKLDLSRRLWPIPNFARAHDHFRWVYYLWLEDEPLLFVQRAHERDRATELQDPHSVQFLSEVAKEGRRRQTVLRRDELTRPAHIQLKDLWMGLYRSQIHWLVMH